METDPRCWPRPAAGRGSGLDAGDGPISVICDPNRVAADGDRARFGADLDRRTLDLAALDVDLPHRVVFAIGNPDGAGAAVDSAGLPSTLIRSTTWSESGSSLETTPARLLATQT